MAIVPVGTNVDSQVLNDNFAFLNDEIVVHEAELTLLASDTASRAINVKYPPAPLVAAVIDGVTSDTVAIQACIDLVVAAGGGIVYLPEGVYITGKLTISDNIIIMGAGRSATQLFTNSTTESVFEVSASYVTISDLSIQNTEVGTPTAGAGIEIATGTFASIQNVQIARMYYGINAVSSSSYKIVNCYIVSSYKYGLYIRNTGSVDTGDQSVVSCTFDTSKTTDAAIRHESAGGLKMVNTKILGHAYGYDLQVADGVDTSVLTITGCSIENQTEKSIRLGRLGTTGTYAYIAITGCQIKNATAGKDVIEIGAGISDVSIGDNSITGSTAGIGIDLMGGVGISIGNNSFYNLGTGVSIASAMTKVLVGLNNYNSVTTPVIDSSANTNTFPPLIEYKFRRAFINVSSDSTYTNVFEIKLSAVRGICRMELTIEGVLAGVNIFGRHIQKLISRGGGNCTVTAISDTAVSSVIDVQFDVATTAGSVLVGIRRNSGAGGTRLDGSMTLNLDGHVQSVVLL